MQKILEMPWFCWKFSVLAIKYINLGVSIKGPAILNPASQEHANLQHTPGSNNEFSDLIGDSQTGV